MIRTLVKWCAAGALAGLFLGAADALVLITSAREMFFGTGELVRTALAAVGLCAGAGALSGLIAGGAAEALIAASQPGRPLDRRFALEVVLTALFAAPLDLALWMLTAGPQASQLPLRPLVVALAAFLLGAGAGLVTIRVARAAARSAARAYAVLAAALAISAALFAIDLTVLVRLYPAFHYGLTAGALLLLIAGLRLVWHRRRWSSLAWIAGLLTLAAVAGGAVSLGWIRSTHNPRFALTDRTAAAVDVVHLARAVAPPSRRQALDELAPTTDEPLPPPTSTGPAISRPGSPLFLITVDAMRHDRLILGDAGSRRRVAPNFDALASQSVVFDRAYTPIPHTSYAVTSFLTGKYVHRLFDVPGAPRVHETWPEVLRRFRYRTGGFFTKAVVFIDRPRFEPYLRQRFGFDVAEMEYRIPAAERVRQTIAFLEAARAEGRGDQVFVWTHFFEPHEPYDPECLRFGDRDEDRYDCELAVVDEALGELLAYIDAHYPQAILIASADHGEEFGDHGGRHHGTTLYDEQVRVPLAIRVPGVAPRVVGEPVNLVDLLGTALAMLEIPVPARMRSQDLTRLMVGRDEGSRETLCEAGDQVMIVREDHKLICDRRADLCRLYDLRADPGETRSIAERRPDLTAALEARIRAWEKSHARVELRPVVADDGEQGWPEPVRRALGGDEAAVLELPPQIAAGRPEAVRRKAAELVAVLWADRPLPPLARIEADGDPVVSAWIAVARHRAGDPEAGSALAGIQPELEQLSPPWRASVLARLEAGDRGAIADACAIAGAPDAPLPERLRAVDLLARVKDRRAAETLLPLVDDYQLTLAAASALADLGHRAAVPTLLKRLKRERFPERRAAIAGALARLGDRRAIPQLAGELAREHPASEALPALVRIGAVRGRGKGLRAEPEPARVFVWAPVAPGRLDPVSGRPTRLFLLTGAAADGGSVVVACDGEELGRSPIASGEQTALVEVADCEGAITLIVEPADVEVEIRAVALVVPD